MIKANELRIGNLLLSEGRLCKMMTLGSADMQFLFSDKCQPITLTPDILKKFDLKLSHNGYEETFSKAGRLHISLGHSYITTVDYVHQYQNLFFALLGTETEIIL